MIDPVTGDPGSCSHLGGVLRSHAGRLLAVRSELVERSAGLRRDAASAALADEVEAHVQLLDVLVDRLDAAGASLQRLAQELSELAESIRRLEAEVHRAGLVMDGLRVVGPWGVLTTELAQRRSRAQPVLQDRADRLASRLGRSRITTVRAMEDGTRALSAAAARARSLR